MTSNIGGRYLDSPDFDPFWEEANRRRVPVFMHPSNSPCYHDDEPPTMLSFPFDTTLSAHKLVYGGLYERFPDVVLILAHLGGALPYLARRIDIAFDQPGFFGEYKQPARRPSESMRKLYVDTALGWNRGAFNCARELVGIEHIVFGTDYFIRGTHFMEWTSEFIDGPRADVCRVRDGVREERGKNFEAVALCRRAAIPSANARFAALSQVRRACVT